MRIISMEPLSRVNEKVCVIDKMPCRSCKQSAIFAGSKVPGGKEQQNLERLTPFGITPSGTTRGPSRELYT